MRFTRLEPTEGEPFGIDLVSWPNCTALLGYLEKKMNINVRSKSSWLLSGDYFAEFEYRNFQFEIRTPLSTPWLIARKDCNEEAFEEIVNCVGKYRFGLPFGGIAFFRYLRLPPYRGPSYRKGTKRTG